MRVLITGAAGNLGSLLSQYLMKYTEEKDFSLREADDSQERTTLQTKFQKC